MWVHAWDRCLHTEGPITGTCCYHRFSCLQLSVFCGLLSQEIQDLSILVFMSWPQASL